jgi:DNA-binding transcriptional ArsR family regulator
MITWRFTADDVARIRFAYSPLSELVLSLIVLRAPSSHALHLPWVRSAQSGVTDIDLSELLALVPASGIVADFLSPAPTTVQPDIGSELDQVRGTPPAQVISDLTDIPGLPAAVRDRIIDDPGGFLTRTTATLQSLWDRTLAPVWPRIQTLLDADVLWRARRLAAGGAQSLFADLDDTVAWSGGHLRVTDPWDHESTLSGQGLLLVPSVMVWPRVRKMVQPYQPMLLYPARGVATLWEQTPPPPPDALARLIGRNRARILAATTEPVTTTTLATRLELSAGGISQHLTVLHAGGLVTRTRIDNQVFYQRTHRGNLLCGPMPDLTRSSPSQL